jgi:hypothetical protein
MRRRKDIEVGVRIDIHVKPHDACLRAVESALAGRDNHLTSALTEWLVLGARHKERVGAARVRPLPAPSDGSPVPRRRPFRITIPNDPILLQDLKHWVEVIRRPVSHRLWRLIEVGLIAQDPELAETPSASLLPAPAHAAQLTRPPPPAATRSRGPTSVQPSRHDDIVAGLTDSALGADWCAG